MRYLNEYELQGVILEQRQGQYPPHSVLCGGWSDLLIEDRPGGDFPLARPEWDQDNREGLTKFAGPSA